VGNLFSELKRRNVVRVGIAYIVLSWVALQVGDVLFEMFETPAWVGKTLAALLLLGFPFALVFAWAFEMTPEGVKRTAEVDSSESITHSTGKKLNLVIIGALVVALGYFIWERQGLVEPGAEADAVVDKSIAVLPFVNMSSDQEQEWFADGLTEEILNALARTPDLMVASRTSSFQFKGQNTDISAIAKALGVAHILEGSVRRGSDRLRVTAQLIRASDGFHLWSETFDSEPEDVIEIQENVAVEIANALKTAMDPEALRQMVSAGTASVAAYEAYLEGLALQGRSAATGNVQDWGHAREAFDRAVAADPEFALAHWNRAVYWDSQLSITTIGGELSELPTEQKAAEFNSAIDAAIAHVENEALSFKFKALKADHEFRFLDSRDHLKRYLDIYPHDVEGQQRLLTAFANVRDFEGAAEYVDRFLEYSHDDALQINALLNNILFIGHVDAAVQLARESVQRFPQHAFLTYQAHRVLLWAGHTEEAAALVDALRRSEFPEENILLVLMRQACAEGDLASAEKHFARIQQIWVHDKSVEYIGLQILGRPDDAHRALLESELDNFAVASFINYPYFDHRYFPEMAAILERQGVERQFIESPPYACKPDQG
jgi:TolB-like protein/tetratricopeptide (TPR) repeat protein